MARLSLDIPEVHKKEFERRCALVGVSMQQRVLEFISRETGIPIEARKKPGPKSKRLV